MKRLAGKVFVITGAGSGIGRSTTLRLVEEGAAVLAVDKSADSVRETARIASTVRGRVEAFEQDITAVDAPTRILGAVIDVFGKVDGIVNNAGIGAAKSAHLTTDVDFDRFIDVNLRSVFRLSRDFILQRGRNGGIIVNLASVFGMTGYPGSAPYSAAKAAVIGLTRQMAADYGRDGYRVNAIAPGMIMTPIHSVERQKAHPEYYRSFVNGTPMGTTADPSVIASAVAFLCSDDAQFVSGHVLVVDGGWLATKRDLPVEDTRSGYHFS